MTILYIGPAVLIRHIGLRLSGLEDDVYIGDFTSILSFDCVDRALKQAYPKLLRLLHHIASLKSVQNSFLSVSSLPPEILLRIFRLCTLQHGNNDDHWLAFSQVCTGWRRLALADPSLWTHLDLQRPRLAKVMSERSKSLPVSVVIPSKHFDLLPRNDRIRSFELTSFYGLDSQLNGFISAQFPLLDTLSLVSDTHIGTCDVTVLGAPQLRALSLHNWIIRDWRAPVMCGLTSLSLVYLRPGPYNPRTHEAAFSLSSILDVLRTCQNLTSLKLYDLIDSFRLEDPGGIDDAAESLVQVKLPHLKLLDLEQDEITIGRFLPSLHLPACDNIVISLYPDERLEALPGAIHSWLRKAHWPTLRVAKLELKDHFKLSLLTSGWPDAPQSTTHTRNAQLVLLRHLVPEEQVSFLNSLAATLLQDVTTLEVRALDTVDVYRTNTSNVVLPDFWASISTLRALHSIELESGNHYSSNAILRAFIQILAAEEFEDSIKRPGVETFPAVRSLTLRNLEMIMLERSVVVHLSAYLDRRKQQQSPVDIVLEDCNTAYLDADLLLRSDIRILTTTSS